MNGGTQVNDYPGFLKADSGDKVLLYKTTLGRSDSLCQQLKEVPDFKDLAVIHTNNLFVHIYAVFRGLSYTQRLPAGGNEPSWQEAAITFLWDAISTCHQCGGRQQVNSGTFICEDCHRSVP